MRDSLTVLAILVIAVLTAALVGPYLIDWNGQRAFIESRLSGAVGTRVTVGGRIDLKLLPRPILRLGDISVGDPVPGRPRLTAAALDAELSLTAMMRGELQVVDTTLERPRLDVTLSPEGSFGIVLPRDEAADRFAFDHVAIRDGTLALRLADGRGLTLAGLDADGEASSLRGPAKLTGRIGEAGPAFRLATGALDHGHLRVKLHLDGAGLRPSFDLDGTAAARSGQAGPSFDGTLAAAGSLPLDASAATVPWRATAHLTADRDAAVGADVEFRAGTDMRALIADGDATAAYAAGPGLPTATLHLHGSALNVDALGVMPDSESASPAPQGVDLLGRLIHLAGDGAAAVSLPMRLDADTRFDTATLDGRTLLGTSATIGLGPEPTAAVAIAADGPDATHLAIDGRVEPGHAPVLTAPFGLAPARSAAVFRGRAEARSNDLRRTSAWLAPAAPAVAAWLTASVPARTVAASGLVEVSNTGIAARDVSLRLDGSRFSGALSLTRAVGAERARVFADLSSDALDIDHLPDLSGTATLSRDLDLDLALQARAVTLTNVAEASGSFIPVAAGHVVLRLTKTGDAVRLDQLSLDVDGARVTATASRKGRDAQAKVHLSAPQLGPVTAAFGSLLPAPVAALLRGRAAALSPADATLDVAASAAADDAALTPTRFALAGTLGGTRIDAALKPDDPADSRAADNRTVAVTLRAVAPDAADLLRQIGLPAVAGFGAARVEGEARGSVAAGFAARGLATLGSTTISYTGRAGAANGNGWIALHATDARPLLAAFGFAAQPAAPVGAEATGDLSWTGPSLAWRHLSAEVGSTVATGDLSVDLTPRRAGADEPTLLGGHLSLDHLAAETLLGLVWGLPDAAAATTAGLWPGTRFGPAPPALPRADLTLRVADMPLRDNHSASAVAMTLRSGGGGLTLADTTARYLGGTVGGSIALRRDGATAALSGHVAWDGLPLALGRLAGRIGGAGDIAATGETPASLVASLAGTGSVTLKGASLARTDPLAPARTAAALDAADAAAYRDGTVPDTTPPDPDAVRQKLSGELDRAALPLGDTTTPATLAAGVVHIAPLVTSGAGWTAETALGFDLGSDTLTARTALRDGPDAATVTDVAVLAGAGTRALDPTSLVDAVQARAIARAQERIDVMEQDIRERAAFNRQLKAIQADQRATREKAEVDRRAAVARAKAAADLRRIEAARPKADVANEADKQRFFDKALVPLDPPLEPAPRLAPGMPSRRPMPGSAVTAPDPFDLPAPPSIVQEHGAPYTSPDQ